MRIATWNVNSVKTRLPRLLPWLARATPDVVCLQELKTVEEGFPFDEIREAGYHACVYGQKTYNGVAILARHQAADVRKGFGDGEAEDPQARLIAADVDGVRVVSAYFPNGSEPDSDKYVYKKAWIARLGRYLHLHHRPEQPLILCGDYNIAPQERDAAKPEAWSGTVLLNPEMSAALQDLAAWGLTDLVRQVLPEERLFTWWDYRNLGFQKGDGLRIDHLFGTAPLVGRVRAAGVDRDERKGEKPSDHAPVWVELH